MINALILALVAEVAFLVGIVLGGIIAALAAMAVTLARGIGRFSSIRAHSQGFVAGLVTGSSSLLVSVALGRYLGISDHLIFWVVTPLPVAGELGHFAHRFVLQHGQKAGIFGLLWRLHYAARAPFERGIYSLSLADLENHEPDEVPALAAYNTTWFVGRAVVGFIAGASVSMLLLATQFHLFTS